MKNPGRVEPYEREETKAGTVRRAKEEDFRISHETRSYQQPGNALLSGRARRSMSVVVELDRQCKAISAGDLSDPEAMLWSQAQLLNHVSSQFAKKLTDGAMSIEAFKTFSDIMLRAQNQTRRTLDSLANLKRPKVQLQQNNAVIQQVNNELPEEKNIANELLEVNHESRLDTGAPQEAIRGDKTLETVERVHRPKNGRR
jgi:hypothetical protein